MPRSSPSDDTRWSVITRAAAGDGAARATFAGTYLPVVRSMLAARWRGTPLAGTVDDAVQQVFIECLREGGVLTRADPARGDLRGLLFGVASNVARRHEERAGGEAGTERAGESTLDGIPAREPSLSVAFDREWAQAMVRLAGELQRARAEEGDDGAKRRVELLRLRFAEGLPIRAIAARWEVDPDALHRAYSRARDEFRACLRQVVGEHAVRTGAELEREVARVLEFLE